MTGTQCIQSMNALPKLVNQAVPFSQHWIYQAVITKCILYRLQEKMNSHDFVIQYKKGAKMPADFLGRNVLEEIQIFTPDLSLLQEQDEFAIAIIN